MARRDPSLRGQLLTWLLVPLALLLAADAFISYRIASSFTQRAHDRALVEIAHEIALRVRAAPEGLSVDLPEAVRSVLFADPVDRVYFEVATADEAVVAGEAIAAAPANSTRAPRAERLYDSVLHDADVRVVQLRVSPNPAAAGPEAIVRVAETKTKRNELTREMVASVIVPQVLLILIAALVVWVGVLRGLLPLKQLQRAIALRSHLDRSPVPEVGVPAEAKPLVHSINGLLERLDGVLTLQSRFIADAAHNLKTPVAGLKAQMELMMRETDPARIKEATARLYIGTERLSRLVSQLLALARNEPEAIQSLALVPMDLDAFALETSTNWVPQALRKQIDLGFEGANQPVMIHGDPTRLRDLLDNLLDNAIGYSRDSGRVTVHVAASPRPTITVSDDGPRIPTEQRERVFERFHRLLGSGHPGSGLGLAIAQEIADLHHADIEILEDSDGVGNTFKVVFPRME